MLLGLVPARIGSDERCERVLDDPRIACLGSQIGHPRLPVSDDESKPRLRVVGDPGTEHPARSQESSSTLR
jgi:hypothetical protein